MEKRCAALAQGGNRRDPAGPAAAHDSALPAPHPGPGAPAPAPASDWVENRATSLRTHSRLSFSSADRPLVTHLTGLGVSHSFQSAHSLLISFLLENNLLQKKKMQGSCRHSLNFSFLCFLFLPPPPDFLFLLFLSFFLPFLPFFCFLPCFSLLSSPHLSLSIPTSLFPHPYFLVSPPSFSVTSLGFSSTCPSLLATRGLRRRHPEEGSPEPTPLELSSHRGLPAQVPAGQQRRSFPPSPRTRSLCPQLPRNLQETPAHNAAHSVAYPLWESSNTSLSNSSNSFPRFQLPSPDFLLGDLPASHTLSTTPASSPGSWAGSGCSRYAPYCL